VLIQVIDYLVDIIFLNRDYESLNNLWQPDTMSKISVLYAMGLLNPFLFTHIFIKSRKGTGIPEGVRYGVIIWLFVIVPIYHTLWEFLPIPYALIFRWTLFGLLEILIARIIVAVIYKPAG
jgi:hypothetical protein